MAHYVPLNTYIISNGKKLGNYLHDMKISKPPEDNFWKEFRKLLISTYYELCICCSGTMLSACIKKGNLISTPLLKTDDIMEKFFNKGETCSLKVTYITLEEYLIYYQNAGLKLNIVTE